MERQQRYDRVIFDNVADQYIKGNDVIAFFTIPPDQQINPNEDQIGLLRVGCTDIKKCLAYSPVKFSPSISSESIQCGTARFSSSSLSVTDDEFYQFCYIYKRTINLGTSMPFQLNCESDDMNYLCNTSIEKLISFDHDDDIVVITQPNFIPTERKFRQTDQHSFESPKKTFIPLHKPTVDRFPSRSTKNFNDSDQVRSQLAVTIQLAKDQATQIVELERHLMQANESTKKSHQQQIILEQQLRDLQLTSEKHQRSLEGQLKYSSNQQLQLERQLRDLTLTSEKYQRSMQGQLKHAFNQQLQLKQQLRDSELTSEKYQRSSQGQLNSYSKQTIHHQDQKQNSIESNEQAYKALKSAYNTIEKRCVKHQQNEIDLKRQFMIHQKFIADLQHEIEHLNTRLSTSTIEYNELFSKYISLEYQTNENFQSDD